MWTKGVQANIWGAFYTVGDSETNGNDTGDGNCNTGTSGSWAFSAALSNSIYGNSTTVQPPAIKLIPQIKY